MSLNGGNCSVLFREEKPDCSETKGGIIMKIEMEGTLIRMIPETDTEKEQLNQLWNVIIDCVNQNRKLVPVGEYIPGMKEIATFNIE